MVTLRWVRPAIVVEVSFVEWTRDRNLRHPAFVAVRGDKRPSDVRRGAVGPDLSRTALRSHDG